jgi:hypothetical protein
MFSPVFIIGGSRTGSELSAEFLVISGKSSIR